MQFLLFSSSINAYIWTSWLEEQETKSSKIRRYIINIHIHKKSEKVLRKSNSRNKSKVVCCLDLAETAHLKIHLTLHITVTGQWTGLHFSNLTAYLACSQGITDWAQLLLWQIFLAWLLTQADLPSQAFNISCVSLNVTASFTHLTSDSTVIKKTCFFSNRKPSGPSESKVKCSQFTKKKQQQNTKKSQLQVTTSLYAVLYFPCLLKQPTSDNEMLKAVRERIRFHLPELSGSTLCNNKRVFLSHSISLEMRQNLCILTAFYN